MCPEILDALRQRRVSIQRRWETLLRVEPVNTPLAIPDAVSRLIPGSLDEIFRQLETPAPTPLDLREARRIPLSLCACNRNPYLAHFKAAEQALLEELVLLQAAQLPHLRHEHDLADIVRITRQLGSAEIESFCGICLHRTEPPDCRHAHHR